MHGESALTIHTCHSITIRRRAKFKFKHIKSASGRRTRNYCLCNECNNYLVEKQDSEKNVWPLFLFHLLFGSHTPVFGNTQSHWDICGGSTLWRLIPQSMRHWWIDEIKTLPGYSDCTIVHPVSVFEDKTLDLKQFNKDYNSEQLSRVVDAMNNRSVIMNNVLCPWTCSASCRDSGRLSLDIMVQRMLPQVILKLYSKAG